MTTETWTPACMDAEELADWSRLNRGITSLANRADRPCADCVPGFAAEMRSEGRCNGVPMGHVEEETPMTEPVSLATRRQAVTVAAPCGTCAHAPVCRIRPEAEALRSLQVVQPALDDAISVELAAEVSCVHYVKARKPGSAPETAAASGKRVISPEGMERMREAGRLSGLRRQEQLRAEREAAAS